jgi:hypothetical protein
MIQRILKLVCFETKLLFKHSLTKPILIYTGGSLFIAVGNLIIRENVSDAIPWFILFISSINIAYAPLMFSWESKEYGHYLSGFPKTGIFFAKWCFVALYIMASTITVLLIFAVASINWMFPVLAYSLFCIGVITFVDLSYACHHIVSLDINSRQGYRHVLGKYRWCIIFIPIVMTALWGVIGYLDSSLLGYYYNFLLYAGCTGLVGTPLWIRYLSGSFAGYPKYVE